jgi:hypothetical protein
VNSWLYLQKIVSQKGEREKEDPPPRIRMVWGCEIGISCGIVQGMSWSMAVKGSKGRRGRKSSVVMSEREKQTAFNLFFRGPALAARTANGMPGIVFRTVSNIVLN